MTPERARAWARVRQVVERGDHAVVVALAAAFEREEQELTRLAASQQGGCPCSCDAGHRAASAALTPR